MKPFARFAVGTFVALLVAWWSLGLAFRLPGPSWIAHGTAIVFGAGGVGGRRGAKQQEEAPAAGQEDALKRAFGACMDGRGYSVK